MLEPECCVLFSTADWDAPYWTNKQHTAALLGKRGTKVLYVESVGLRAPSASSGKDWSRLGKRLVTGLRSLLMGPKKVQANVWVLSPLVFPFKHGHAWVRWFNQSLLKFQIALFFSIRKLKSPLIWTYHPFMLDVLKRMNTGKLIYHCVDDLSAVPGIDAVAFKAEEQKLLKQANVVFATAPALAERCSCHNENTYYFSNVADNSHFSQALLNAPLPADLAIISEPRIGYHGVLSDYKIDFQLLFDIARMRPDWNFILIGEEREGQKNKFIKKLKKIPNVYFLGYKKYQILPEYLRGIHIGILPSIINNYTCSMFPMKYYEYLAAGISVVSTPLDAINEIQGCVKIANNSEEFVDAIAELLKIKGANKMLCNKIAQSETWSGRMRKMMEKIYLEDGPNDTKNK